MYPACILYVSWNHCRYMYPACIPHKSLHVSHMYSSWRVQDTCIVILYLVVSWCILMKNPRYTNRDVSYCILTCIQCATKEAPKIHVSWCIWCVSQNVSWTRLGYV
jgi:hypothetical protein